MPATLTEQKVYFHFLEGGQFSLSQRLILKSFIGSLFKKEKKRLAGIHYIFCSDEHLLNMNRQFLQHDYYTDIITFGLSGPGEPIQAEIYISVDRVKENALQFESSFKREMHRVIFHGALHLCGYKDKKKQDILLMRKMEDKYITLYFSR
jgi:rRNA maturation RNase YbeY